MVSNLGHLAGDVSMVDARVEAWCCGRDILMKSVILTSHFANEESIGHVNAFCFRLLVRID